MFYDSGWLYGELPNKIASTRCYQKMKCQKCLFFVFFSQTVFLGKNLFPDRNSWNSDFIRIQIVFRRIDYSLSQCVKHARLVVVSVFFRWFRMGMNQRPTVRRHGIHIISSETMAYK